MNDTRASGFSWYHPKSRLGAQAWCGNEMLPPLPPLRFQSCSASCEAVQVVRLSRGQLFGELALLGDQPRAASARCASLALIALVLSVLQISLRFLKLLWRLQCGDASSLPYDYASSGDPREVLGVIAHLPKGRTGWRLNLQLPFMISLVIHSLKNLKNLRSGRFTASCDFSAGKRDLA